MSSSQPTATTAASETPSASFAAAHLPPPSTGVAAPLADVAGDDYAGPVANPRRLPGRADSPTRPGRACSAPGLTAAAAAMGGLATGPQHGPRLAAPGCAHPAGPVPAIALPTPGVGDRDGAPTDLLGRTDAAPRLHHRRDPPRLSFPDPPPARFAEPSAGRAEYPAQGATGLAPPRYAKLEFATYDGVEDPLNWLNQCEQFFRGQHTLASDRTWLASYHLRGAAQMCRLAELGRLAFTTTVQDFADRFQALACHAPGVTGQQRAELFIGGLRTTSAWMSSYRPRGTFRRRCTTRALMSVAPRRFSRRPWPAAPALPASSSAAAATRPTWTDRPAPAATRTFRRLTPAEQLERRRLGLCFNCDDPYTPGHVCPRLFYLETVDVEEGDPTTGPVAAASEMARPTDAAATAFVVSLHALAGIRHERTMLLPVTIQGEPLVALLDTGSTHNFLPAATMRRLALQPTGGDTLHVTVANGDRLHCHGVVQHVPLTIGDEHFVITCAGINLGCFDFILGVDFLRTLGPILWDFDALTMTFWRQGRHIRWEGLAGTSPAPQL
ncbi:hypothetical protein QYE76_012930 [Lolium multiflorum]|uniref:Uncharacterized protein n=1 Tax=Lolium multiflorum TaxID=4521 RepID=A0AAD8U1I1_LOLMU|nr:hypothetical protein QYE76_012930 [Lolium multiflorum]